MAVTISESTNINFKLLGVVVGVVFACGVGWTKLNKNEEAIHEIQMDRKENKKLYDDRLLTMERIQYRMAVHMKVDLKGLVAPLGEE